MKKTAITLLFFLFLVTSAKAELDPEYGVPRYIIRTKPKYISAEDAAFLFKNQSEQLAVTFVEREREYAKVLGLPIFPKKVWNIRYEKSYNFNKGWNTIYTNEVGRELAKGQYNVWIAIFIWSFIVLWVSDRFSSNGIFGVRNRKAYDKVSLSAGIVFFLFMILFFRFVDFLGLQSSLYVNLDLVSILFLWGAMVVTIIYRNYKVPAEKKSQKIDQKPIGV